MSTQNTTYRDFVVKEKAKRGVDIFGDLKDFDDATLERVLSRMHGVIGLITELNEIQAADDEQNFIEELGDYYFYLTLLKHHSGFDEHNIGISSDLTIYDWESTRYAAGELLDLTAKREVIYARELNAEQVTQFHEHLQTVNGYFFFVLHNIGMTEDEIQAHNMAKLDKRYAAGYSNEAAAARADKTEDKEGE